MPTIPSRPATKTITALAIRLFFCIFLLNAFYIPKAQTPNGRAALACNNWLNIVNPNDVVRIGDLDVPGTQITVEATCNRVLSYTGMYALGGNIVSKHNSPSDCNYLLRPNLGGITTSNGFFEADAPCLADPGTTYHVALVYDGATLKFYRNGFLLKQVPASGNLYQNDYITAIGNFAPAWPAAGDESMIGYINEVRIWNVARTQAQIRTYMNSSLPTPSTQTGLLAYYTFNSLVNQQGNALWNGTLTGSAAINATNPNCSFPGDSCHVTTNTPVTAAFTSPDTVCVNSPVTITDNSIGASNWYWSFCSANLSNTMPTATNLGNLGGTFSAPVFMDYIQVNGNWYGFLINQNPGGLVRLDFGNSLLNTPTATSLGNFSGNLPPGAGSEGIQIVYNEGNYYAIIVGGWPTTGSTPRILTMNFGANITNTTPVVSNWGNLGNMLQPIDLYVFKDNSTGNWYGLTVNAENNTITRFNFTNSFNNPPTGVNLGNIGNLAYPTGIYAIEDNGNWRVFVVNGGSNTTVSGTFSLTRLDFGNSLLNTPTGVNLGSLGNKLQHPRDLTIMKSCGQIVGFAVNGNPNYNDIVKFDFNNNLLSTPVATSLGNIGNFSFPHSISRLFRVNDNLYGFVTNAANNTLARLQFAGCTNASISSSTLQNPPAFSYNTPGTYNINLTIDDGLATQNAYCKQVVVVPPLTHHATKNFTLCPGQSIKVGAASTNGSYLWSDGITSTDSLLVTAPGTYWVDESKYGCSNRDSFIVNTITSPCAVVTPGFTAPDTVCVNSPVTITNTSAGASTYYWNFCVANINTPPVGVNLGNIGGIMNSPVYMDYVLDNGNYYGFVTDNYTARLFRLDFGASLLNTPSITDFGTLGGVIPPNVEGIQVVKNEGKWYAIIVGGDLIGAGVDARIVRVEFGATITNPTPVATNWGNIGAMAYPHDLYLFNDNNIWYGVTVNTNNNTITRFNFTNSFSNTPTAVNFGNIGNLSGPTGIYAIQDNGNWYAFVTNAISSTLTRLNFGSSLLNTPTGVNLGNPGGKFHAVWDITFLKYCGNLQAYAINADQSYNDLLKLDFNGNITSTPSVSSFGNVGSMSFPHSLSKFFRVGADVYAFTTNVANHTLTRFRFPGCTNASIPNSTAQNPPPVTYNTPGTYNINLTVDDGLPTQDAYCRQVVVMPAFTHHPPQYINLCQGDSIKIGAATTTARYLWSDGITTTDSLMVKIPGTYWVDETNGGCSNRDSFIVSSIPAPIPGLGNDTTLCPSANLLLDAGNPGASYLWQDGSTGQTFQVTASGTYHVIVTGSNGCKTKDTIVVTKSGLPVIDFSIKLDPCNPLSVSFYGVGPGSLSPWWDFGDGSPALTGNTSPVHLYTAFGDYTVRFTDQNSACTDTIIKIISVSVIPADIITTSDTTICAGSSKKLLALPALSYCWTPAAYLDNPAIATPTTTTPGTITYYLNAQVQGANLIVNGDFNAGNTGFTSGYQYKPPPNTTEGQYYVGTNPNAWNGGLSNCRDHTTGTGNMFLVNGSPVLNVKVWTQTVNVTPNTTYAFSTWIQALYPPNPAQLEFSINGLDIGAPITASLPTCTWSQFYTTWNSGSNTTAVISIVNKNTLVLGNDFALDDISFSPLIIKRDSVIITVDTPIIKATNDTMMCQGSTMQLNAAGGISYVWSPATGLSNAAIANPVAAPAASGRYIVTGTDSYGCSAKDTVNITVNPLPVTDFSMQLDPCNPLSVTLTNIGTALPASWWDFGDGNTLTGVPNTTHTYAAPGNYTVRFSLSTATCTDTITKTIIVGAIPANIITTPDTTVCTGSTKKLFAVPALSYCWTPAAYLDNPAIATPVTSTPVKMTYYLNAQVQGANLIANGDFSAGNAGFTTDYLYATPNITEGQYYVGASPNAWNGGLSNCTDHTTGTGNMLLVNGSPVFNMKVWTQTVSVTPNTNYAFSTWVQALYTPNPAQLQFSINGLDIGNPITASLPTCTWTQFYTTWNSGSNTTAVIAIVNKNTIVLGNDFALDDISFSPLTIKRDSVTISIDTPVVKATNDTVACRNIAIQLNAAGAVLYTWTPAAGLSSTDIANPIANPPVTTQYIVSGTDQYGCTAKDTLLFTVNPLPVITHTADTIICHDQSLQLYAQGGASYAWTPAASLSDSSVANPVASPGHSTFYTVVVTDGNNCSSKAPVVVIVQQAPVFSVSGNTAACKGTPVQFLAQGGDVYSWSPADGLSDPNAANPLAAPDASTVYQVKIIETTCQDSALLSTSLRILPVPTVTAHKSNDVDCAVPMSLLSATGAMRYLWSPGTGLSDSLIYDPVAKPTASTTYMVSGIGANGCVGYDSVKVMVNKMGDLLFNIPNAFTPNNDGHNDCFGAGRYAALINSMEIAVYNRWGTRLFYSTSPNACWDGTYNGKPQDPGGYPYIIKAKTLCGEVIKKGVLILVR